MASVTLRGFGGGVGGVEEADDEVSGEMGDGGGGKGEDGIRSEVGVDRGDISALGLRRRSHKPSISMSADCKKRVLSGREEVIRE